VTETWEEKVLATFLPQGRLVQVPARRKKRLVVLRWLADHFRPAERYSEAQVNDLLRRYHEDVATLRRLLVDEELMQRDRGLYWRAGTLPRLRPADPVPGVAATLMLIPHRGSDAARAGTDEPGKPDPDPQAPGAPVVARRRGI
jgi:hypothetical protein